MATKRIHDTKEMKNGTPPPTVVMEGTAKRNILRKGGKGKYRKERAVGAALDDGSTFNPLPTDHNDPNYDSEDESDQYVPGGDEFDVGLARITLSEYKKLIDPIINEFFRSGDVNDLAQSLQEIDAKEYSYELVKRIINKSLDKHDHERELVSQFLSYAYPDILST
jgi:hypothetical protein